MGAVCCSKRQVYKHTTLEKIEKRDAVWIIAIDNIFLDVAKEIQSDDWLVNENIAPGSQNTALTPAMKATALKVLNATEDEMKELSRTAGGCSMNTTRAANYWFRANGEEGRLLAMGSIGDDETGKIIKT